MMAIMMGMEATVMGGMPQFQRPTLVIVGESLTAVCGRKALSWTRTQAGTQEVWW